MYEGDGGAYGGDWGGEAECSSCEKRQCGREQAVPDLNVGQGRDCHKGSGRNMITDSGAAMHTKGRGGCK